MDNQFLKIKKTLRETNWTLIVALQCATFLLRQARELSPDQRREMLGVLKDLISLDPPENEPVFH